MLAALVYAALTGLVLLPQQQPPRDARPIVRDGAATITGAVISDEPSPKPSRRARVMLNGAALPMGRTVITNDEGIFVFEALPAGRYSLSATKEGYVAMFHGATRFGSQGTTITVQEAEVRTLTLRIPRGSVITAR